MVKGRQSLQSESSEGRAICIYFIFDNKTKTVK